MLNLYMFCFSVKYSFSRCLAPRARAQALKFMKGVRSGKSVCESSSAISKQMRNSAVKACHNRTHKGIIRSFSAIMDVIHKEMGLLRNAGICKNLG